ncbi:MAG: hypothetical protein KAT93_09000 [Desulfuromonadales bacterium]|nr:hypothetical protein [Desulfuromonadales bacterium]
MKHFVWMFFLAAMLVFNGSLALAMHHDQNNHKGHDMSTGHDNHAQEAHQGHNMAAGHDGMSADGKMLMLKNTSVDGVTGMAHIKDVSAAMAKMGMDISHHFMLMLHDDKSGDPIETGTVAVKIKGPDGKTGNPVKLMGMQGHFGADVILPEKGAYVFIVGSKLDDGQKRTFEYNFDYK